MSTTMTESVVSPNWQAVEDASHETVHWVCHCKNDEVSYCGIDMKDEPWKAADDHPCPLCELATQAYPGCPWGCECGDC